MPDARPNADELLQAVAEFLTYLSKNELNGQAAFHARVAANALAIARREVDQKPTMDACEVSRMKEILGHDGDHVSLNEELAKRLRFDDAKIDRSETLSHLRQVVQDKLLISNPKYLTARDRDQLGGVAKNGG